jgi:hypothetical protein
LIGNGSSPRKALSKRSTNAPQHNALPIVYQAVKLKTGYRVDGVVVAEVKSVDALAPVREAHVLPYRSRGKAEKFADATTLPARPLLR